ncbi:MAG TPA: carbon storage regulator CsrA [bacterium]|nr:carbon storage regulator CsrA [bacterium]
MLVLSRRPGEHITIGENVVVRVLAVKGDTIQLGIDAPRNIAVHRGEIRAQILSEIEAARASAADPAAMKRLLDSRRKDS